jgi:hypothetical protein
MNIGQRVSYVAPLLRSLRRPVRDEDLPFEEYRVSIIRRSRSRDVLMNMTVQDMIETLSDNVIVWVSPNCFIMKTFFEDEFFYLLNYLELLPKSFAQKIVELFIVDNSLNGLDFHIYCTADSEQKTYL